MQKITGFYNQLGRSAKLILLANILYAIAIVSAHFFAPEGYDWSRNTFSQIAGQGHDFAWIMRLGFIVYGGLLIISIFNAKNKQLSEFLLLVYAAAVVISGLFSSAAIQYSADYSAIENSMHAFFSGVGGIAISGSILASAAQNQDKKIRRRQIIYFIGILTLIALFGLAKRNGFFLGRGLVQRVLFGFGSIWMLQNYVFSKDCVKL